MWSAQNNPLSFTDPSGYFLSGLFKKIGRVLGNIARGFMSFAKAVARSTIGRAIIQIAACAFGGTSGMRGGISRTDEIRLL